MQTDKSKTFWQAVRQRDKSFEGKFVFAVSSTGVFCRPGCPSRTPSREKVQFFATCKEASEAGFRPCRRCRPTETALKDIQAVCDYMLAHVDERLPLAKLSEISGLSPFHLQRKFKAVLGITPREYVEQHRMARLKAAMRNGFSVTDAVYEAGFGSSSRVYERTAAHLGMTPKAYREGGNLQIIRYAFQSTSIGLLLVAATDKGVCAIQFGDSEGELLKHLQTEFSHARLIADSDRLKPHLESVSDWLAGQTLALDLPLDIRATVFQRRVWQYLQQIPYGQTRSYSEIASDLGNAKATRAVARACATNPVSLVIPCHRVVRQDGKLAGYRWGMERKESILKLERENSLSRTAQRISVRAATE